MSQLDSPSPPTLLMGLRTVHVVYEIEQRFAESRRYEAMKDEYDQDPSRKEMEQIMKHRWLLNDDDTVEVYNRKDCTPRPDGKNVPSLRCGT